MESQNRTEKVNLSSLLYVYGWLNDRRAFTWIKYILKKIIIWIISNIYSAKSWWIIASYTRTEIQYIILRLYMEDVIELRSLHITKQQYLHLFSNAFEQLYASYITWSFSKPWIMMDNVKPERICRGVNFSWDANYFKCLFTGHSLIG